LKKKGVFLATFDQHTPHILLVNPWITDFSAYNFWIRPFGLLGIASLLRRYGFRVTLMDCLDFYSKTKKYGDGNFFKTRIEKPAPYRLIPRHYCQYGIPEEILLKRLSLLEDKPDLIAVTSGMTYWYPGVFKLIEITKNIFKETPVILGGIYATLCYDHAQKHSGADWVFKGGNEWEAVKLIADLTGFQLRTPVRNGFKPFPTELQTDIYPAFDLYPRLDYICIATSRGCPFRCTYCASHLLTDGFSRRDPIDVADEIDYWTAQFRIDNIAFYDDALLIEPSNHFVPLMKEVIGRGVSCNFHTPNALHVRAIDEEVADLLFRCRFRTIRLGFETSNEKDQVETGGKVSNKELQRAIHCLKRAGYPCEEIGVYIMAGLPGQRAGEVRESIAFVKEASVTPVLVEYSPIPHTPLFEEAKKSSTFDLENEPLYHNNTILPCQWEGFTLADFRKLKEDIRRG
jgi:radical SAM superfamily enzyme YgiQ (UPF0313 family)